MKLSPLLLAPCLAATISAGPITTNSYPGSDPGIETRTLDEQYAAAQNESGDLVVLWGGDAVSQGAGAVSAWEKRFPKIKLNLTVDVSKYHDSRVDREYQISGKDGADIAFLQTLHDFDRWKREGRLLPYKPATWSTIFPNVKDPDGAFFGAWFYQFGDIVYDTNLLNESQVPTTFDKFLDPVWKDKLVLVWPNDDDAVGYLFSLIIGQYGWEWFETLVKQQNVQWVRGTGTPAALLDLGNSSRSASFTTNLISSNHLAVQSAKDPHVSWPQTGAIFASTPRPESAKLFMNWIMSDEYQETLVAGGIPITRTGVNTTTPATAIWTDQSVAATQFGKFEVNRQVAEWWRLQYETELGTAQGPSPLDLAINQS